MTYMICCFVNMIHGSFEFYQIVFKTNYSSLKYHAYLDVMWIIYYALYLTFIIIMSSLVKREGLKTAVLVHKAINFNRNPKVIKKVS